jgi:hypothetical protein
MHITVAAAALQALEDEMGPFYAAETRKPPMPYRPVKPIPAWLNLVLMLLTLPPMLVALVAWECVGVRIARALKTANRNEP